MRMRTREIIAVTGVFLVVFWMTSLFRRGGTRVEGSLTSSPVDVRLDTRTKHLGDGKGESKAEALTSAESVEQLMDRILEPYLKRVTALERGRAVKVYDGVTADGRQLFAVTFAPVTEAEANETRISCLTDIERFTKDLPAADKNAAQKRFDQFAADYLDATFKSQGLLVTADEKENVWVERIRNLAAPTFGFDRSGELFNTIENGGMQKLEKSYAKKRYSHLFGWQ